MIPISYVFEDQDERLIEELTIKCFYKYGDAFLESLIPFFETGAMTEMESYFDKEYSTLFEVEKEFDDEMKAKVKARVKDSIKAGRDYSENITGKRQGIRKLTHRMSKSKIGRAIVKAVRRVGYGTKIGRKIVRKHAAKVNQSATDNINTAGRYGKEAVRRGLVGEKIGKPPKGQGFRNAEDLFARARASADQKMASDKFGKAAGVAAHQASKKLRQSHQLNRNADFIAKRKQEKARAKRSNTRKMKSRKAPNVPLLAPA